MWKWVALLVLVVGIVGAIVWAKVGKTTGDYIESTTQAPDIARRNLAVPQVEEKVRMYLTTHGSYPASLEDLGDLPRLPDGSSYGYDQATGKVWIVDGK